MVQNISKKTKRIGQNTLKKQRNTLKKTMTYYD